MKLTPSSILAHTRANWCCEFPVRSKNDAIRESVPITIVHSRIKGVENTSERTRLIESPTIPPAYVGRILVLDTAKGGVASAWMLHEMQSRGMAPLAFLFNSVNPILVQGAALGDVPMLAGFDQDITAAIPNGAELEIDPKLGVVTVVG